MSKYILVLLSISWASRQLGSIAYM